MAHFLPQYQTGVASYHIHLWALSACQSVSGPLLRTRPKYGFCSSKPQRGEHTRVQILVTLPDRFSHGFSLILQNWETNQIDTHREPAQTKCVNLLLGSWGRAWNYYSLATSDLWGAGYSEPWPQPNFKGVLTYLLGFRGQREQSKSARDPLWS